ncbi:hypothetical protein [Kitasatospora sp. NPDC089509]|uniref:hypothetical protein n=1 Tax=Kitasatospora sp. NPDC089509 TaxID=3364079 RepID=UPI00380E72D7
MPGGEAAGEPRPALMVLGEGAGWIAERRTEVVDGVQVAAVVLQDGPVTRTAFGVSHCDPAGGGRGKEQFRYDS